MPSSSFWWAWLSVASACSASSCAADTATPDRSCSWASARACSAIICSILSELTVWPLEILSFILFNSSVTAWSCASVLDCTREASSCARSRAKTRPSATPARWPLANCSSICDSTRATSCLALSASSRAVWSPRLSRSCASRNWDWRPSFVASSAEMRACALDVARIGPMTASWPRRTTSFSEIFNLPARSATRLVRSCTLTAAADAAAESC